MPHAAYIETISAFTVEGLSTQVDEITADLRALRSENSRLRQSQQMLLGKHQALENELHRQQRVIDLLRDELETNRREMTNDLERLERHLEKLARGEESSS